MEVDTSLDNPLTGSPSRGASQESKQRLLVPEAEVLSEPPAGAQPVEPPPSPGPRGGQKPFKVEARDIVLQNFLSAEQMQQQLAQEQRGEAGTKNADFVDAYLSTP